MSPETCRADLKRLKNEKSCCILLVAYIVVPVDMSIRTLCHLSPYPTERQSGEFLAATCHVFEFTDNRLALVNRKRRNTEKSS